MTKPTQPSYYDLLPEAPPSGSAKTDKFPRILGAMAAVIVTILGTALLCSAIIWAILWLWYNLPGGA
jgi:hypothetical protein